jgi:hypothetical protein
MCHSGLKYMCVHALLHVQTRLKSKEITKSQGFHVNIKKCTTLAPAFISRMNHKQVCKELIAYFPLL